MSIHTPQQAYQLLQDLGAPPRLIQHLQLVGEAAELLIAQLQKCAIVIDADFVRLGAAIHDAGKILYPTELSQAGNRHESAGERLLLEHGVDGKLARCCRSHAQWASLEVSLEKLLIALADNLWKGKRHQVLEQRVIQELAQQTAQDYWDAWVELDTCFETIAAGGDDRLARSAVSGQSIGD